MRIADCGLRIADCGLRIADCGLRIADCGLRIAVSVVGVAGRGEESQTNLFLILELLRSWVGLARYQAALGEDGFDFWVGSGLLRVFLNCCYVVCFPIVAPDFEFAFENATGGAMDG
jgi:hypothetical protein